MKPARKQFALCASLVGFGLAAPGGLSAKEPAVPFAVVDSPMWEAVWHAPSADAVASEPIPRPQVPQPEGERRFTPAVATGPSEPKHGEARRAPDWLTVSESWLQGGRHPPADAPDGSMPLPKAVSDAADEAFSEPMSPYVRQDRGTASLVQRVVDLAESHGPAPVAPIVEQPGESAALTGPAPVEATIGVSALGQTHGDRVLQELAAVRWDELRWRGDVLATPDDEPVFAQAQDASADQALLPSDRGPQAVASEPVGAGHMAVLPQDELFADLRGAPGAPAADDVPDGLYGTPSDELFGDLRKAPDDTVADAAQAGDGQAVGSGWLALSDSKLDDVRGGFVVDGGLRISFGIERAVYINGSLVTTTRLNMSELGKATAAQGSARLPATGGLTLIQSGAGNSVLTGPISASSVGTVIQNTLNNQQIQSLTVIDATVNSMQILKSLNLQSALRGAVTDSLRR